MALSEYQNIHKLTFLCFIDVLKWKNDTIATTPIRRSQHGPTECIWNIDGNRLEQLLKNKSDNFMCSDMFSNYDEKQKTVATFFPF